MNRRTFLPILWPLLLLLAQFGLAFSGRLLEHRRLQRTLDQGRHRLETLRAQAVAGRIDGQQYEELLTQFGELTGLQASDPFRDPKATGRGSNHVASLVTGIQSALAIQMLDPDGPAVLEFLSVSPGGQQRMGPFVTVEFALNLRGRFHAIAGFLDLLTEIGRKRSLAISIGSLSVSSDSETPATRQLSITLPIRAYFRD